MKKYNLYTGWLPLLLLLVFSCKKPDQIEAMQGPDGLLNFSVSIPGESAAYSANKAGPYRDGDTLFINVPTSEEEPVDVARLKPAASLANNSRMTPGLPGILDFTTPIEITVVTGKGVAQKNVIKVIPTLPKTLFKKVWFKNAQTLGIKFTNISGMTVLGDNLLVADFDMGNPGDLTRGVRVLDKVTGAFKKVVGAPTSFTTQVCADDAGHFTVNRYNIYGAGFMLYYYEDINSAPKLLLNYAAGDGCPVELGKKMSITGNLKEGKAYVYTAVEGTNTYFYWEFINGVPVSNIPKSVSYAGAGGPWSYGIVKRMSIEENSGHYISYCHYDGADTDLKKGSRFDIVSATNDITQLRKENHDYKILDFDVFTVNGDKFLVILQQGFWAWDATSVKVFEITDEGKLNLVPSDGGYKDFMLFASDIYGGVNYNKWGDIVADVKGNEVYIYASLSNTDAATSGIMAYRMIYTPQ